MSIAMLAYNGHSVKLTRLHSTSQVHRCLGTGLRTLQRARFAHAVVGWQTNGPAVSVCMPGAIRVPTASCCRDPSALCSTAFVRRGYFKYNQHSHRPAAVTNASSLAARKQQAS